MWDVGVRGKHVGCGGKREACGIHENIPLATEYTGPVSHVTLQ